VTHNTIVLYFLHFIFYNPFHILLPLWLNWIQLHVHTYVLNIHTWWCAGLNLMDVTGTIWCCNANLVTASWYSLTKYSTHKFLKFWQRQLHGFYQLSITLPWQAKHKNLLNQQIVFGSRHLCINNGKNDLGVTYIWRGILHCRLQSVHRAISAFQVNKYSLSELIILLLSLWF
jgi:hypothetical protein